MVFGKLFEPFIAGSPVSVMFRGTLENLLAAERLDRIFENAAQKQTCRDLAFSTCADLLGMVVTRIRRSVNAAYLAHREAIAVSVQAVYDKLAGIEAAVSEALVRETARDLAEIQAKMHASWPGPLPGLDVRIADANHLAGTQHRMKELRRLGDAALPGHTLAVLNPQRQLIEDVVVCEDGHAERNRFGVLPFRIKLGNLCKTAIGFDELTDLFWFQTCKPLEVRFVIARINDAVIGLAVDCGEEVRELLLPGSGSGPILTPRFLPNYPAKFLDRFALRILLRLLFGVAGRLEAQDSSIGGNELLSRHNGLARLSGGDKLLELLAQPLPRGGQFGPGSLRLRGNRRR